MGQKFQFSGGINELNDINIASTEAISGQNFELGLGNTKLKPRKPFDLVGTTTNAATINGILQLTTRAGSTTTLIGSGADIYAWDGSTFTYKGVINAASELHSFDWPLDESINIVDRNLYTPVSTWDGTTFSTLTHGIAGVTNLYAKYGVVANGRTVLANIKTDSTANPHMIIFSEFEDTENFDITSRSGFSGFTTGDEPFYILTPDLKPVNAMLFFMDLLIISTEDGKLFKLVGDDSTNYRWDDFYVRSSAIGNNSFVNAGDDVYYMRSGGVIESLKATDTYGDVGTDDVSLRVRDTVKDATGMRAVYDQTNRKIYFFLTSQVIVLFKDLLPTENSPFSIYKTTHDSGFQTNAAEYVKSPVTGKYTVLFGDSLGNIYDMNGTGTSGDAGTDDIVMTRGLPLQEFSYSNMLQGRVFYRKIAECTLKVEFLWGDESNTTEVQMTLKSPTTGAVNNNYFGGIYYGEPSPDQQYFGEGVITARTPVSKGFSAIGKGSSVSVTLSITTSENYEIDYIEV